MKKHCFRLALVVCTLLLVCLVTCLTVSADGEAYGMILRMAENDSSWINSFWQVKILTADNQEIIYDVAEKVKINGVTYEDGYYNDVSCELYEVLPTGVFVKYFVNSSNELTRIFFDDTATTYTDAVYNKETDTFENVEEDILGLPVFYCEAEPNYENNYVSEQILILQPDEQHRYILDVYDYGVAIRDYDSLYKEYTIKRIVTSKEIIEETIETDDSITFDYKHDLIAEFETSARNMFLGYSLFNSSSQIVRSGILKYDEYNLDDGVCELVIEGLENKTEDYVLYFWLEDDAGNIVSPEYVANYSVIKKDVAYGMILRMAENNSSWINSFWQVKILTADNQEIIYDVAEKVKINGVTYEDGYYNGKVCDLDEIVPVYTNIKYLVNLSNEIMSIYFDENVDTFAFENDIYENVLDFNFIIANSMPETKICRAYVGTYRGNTMINTKYSQLPIRSMRSENFGDVFKDVKKGDILKLFLWDDSMRSYISSRQYVVEETDSGLVLTQQK